MSERWTRGLTIAVIQLIVAIALFVLAVRRWF